MNLGESSFGFLFQPQIMIFLLLQIYILELLQSWQSAKYIVNALGCRNIYCEELHVFFTKNSNIILYAASTRNQRIEALWSWLKKINGEYFLGG